MSTRLYTAGFSRQLGVPYKSAGRKFLQVHNLVRFQFFNFSIMVEIQTCEFHKVQYREVQIAISKGSRWEQICHPISQCTMRSYPNTSKGMGRKNRVTPAQNDCKQYIISNITTTGHIRFSICER